MVYMIFLFVFILIIWFNTEAFVEYSHLLKIKWFKVNEYLIAKDSDFTLTYHSYLLQKHNSFFTRLITCPFCLNFWLILLGKFIFGYTFLEIPTIYVTSLITYCSLTKCKIGKILSPLCTLNICVYNKPSKALPSIFHYDLVFYLVRLIADLSMFAWSNG